MYFDRDMIFLRKTRSIHLLRKKNFHSGYAYFIFRKIFMSRLKYIERKSSLEILLRKCPSNCVQNEHQTFELSGRS